MARHLQLRNLKIGHWNANGLANKTSELQDFLQKHKIDIMLINETNLTPKMKNPDVPGYICYRKDRKAAKSTTKNPGGGVLALVNELLDIGEFPINFETKIEILGLKLNNVLIYSAYAPQNTIDDHSLNKMFNSGQQVIIMGDLNSRHPDWNCRGTNGNGVRLRKYIKRSRYELLAPNEFTFYPSNSKNNPSTIDLALIKNITNVQIHTLDELDSDHLPLMLTFDSEFVKNENKNFFNYKRANWTKFRENIDKNLTVTCKLKSKQHINAAVKNLTNIIQDSMRACIPTAKVANKKYNLNPEIKKLITERNRLRKLFQRTGNFAYRDQKNSLSNLIKSKVKDLRNKNWNEKLEKLSLKDGSLFKLTKYFTKRVDRRLPVLTGENGPITETADKVSIIADHFENAHILTKDFGDRAFDKRVKKKYKKIKRKNLDLDDIKFISPREIKAAIKITKPRKAPGHDNIQNIVLKNLPFKALTQLANIFNACLKISYFPKDWKKAIILPFQKPGKDKHYAQNYRPISLLPTLSKVFERVILNRVLEHEMVSGILVSEQYGFRARRSTVQQLIRITNMISSSFNKNQSVAMMLLDIEKAFDAVWHHGLIYILHKYKFPIYIIKIIMNYLKSRSFRVQAEDVKSSKRRISAGVPQGSILGPVLFIFFINNLPKRKDTELALYADDTGVLSASWKKALAVKRVKEHFQEISDFFYKWKIKINVNKTELIVFAHKRKEKVESIMIDEELIEPKSVVKYLGMHLDAKLSFTEHIKKIRARAIAAKTNLHNLLNRRSSLSIKNKMTIFQLLIRPVLLYAAPVWSNTCKSNLKKLESVQSKILRTISKEFPNISNEVIRNKLEINSLQHEIEVRTRNFFQFQIQHIDEIKNIGDISAENAPFKLKYKMPNFILQHKK